MDELDIILEKILDRDPCLRKGQFVFNECYYLFPEAVNKLRGSNVDCFYNDMNIGVFIDRLRYELSLQQQRDRKVTM